jgi:hypothetical protein
LLIPSQFKKPKCFFSSFSSLSSTFTLYTTPTTIELLKGKEGELKKQNSTPKKRERHTHKHTKKLQ